MVPPARFRQRQTHRKVGTQSLRSTERKLHDSGTARITVLHRAALSEHVCATAQAVRRGSHESKRDACHRSCSAESRGVQHPSAPTVYRRRLISLAARGGARTKLSQNGLCRGGHAHAEEVLARDVRGARRVRQRGGRRGAQLSRADERPRRAGAGGQVRRPEHCGRARAPRGEAPLSLRHAPGRVRRARRARHAAPRRSAGPASTASSSRTASTASRSSKPCRRAACSGSTPATSRRASTRSKSRSPASSTPARNTAARSASRSTRASSRSSSA